MADRDERIRGVLVQIFGDEYQISSETDPADVQRIAAYVDEKMRKIAGQHAKRLPKYSLAVLAAMEITSELFGAMREQGRLAEKARESLDRLSRLVDERADIYSSVLERRAPSMERVLREQPFPGRDPAPVE